MPLIGVLFAVILSLKDYPSTAQTDSELSVTAILECARCGDSYLRGVFFPSGSNYFGFTQNNAGTWVSVTSDKTQYLKVSEAEIQSGTWSGQIRVRPDSASPDYTGPGAYSFKLIRYTASGSKSAETNPVLIQVLGPYPSLTPSSTPQSTATPRPSPPPPVSLPISRPSLIPTEPAVLDDIPPTGTVIAGFIASSPSATPRELPPQQKFSYSGTIFILLGITGLGIAGFILIYSYNHDQA